MTDPSKWDLEWDQHHHQATRRERWGRSIALAMVVVGLGTSVWWSPTLLSALDPAPPEGIEARTDQHPGCMVTEDECLSYRQFGGLIGTPEEAQQRCGEGWLDEGCFDQPDLVGICKNRSYHRYFYLRDAYFLSPAHARQVCASVHGGEWTPAWAKEQLIAWAEGASSDCAAPAGEMDDLARFNGDAVPAEPRPRPGHGAGRPRPIGRSVGRHRSHRLAVP